MTSNHDPQRQPHDASDPTRILGGCPTYRPGQRPGMHQPERLYVWVFEQHQVWIDRHGTEHDIESLSLEYARAIIAFCKLRATLVHRLIAFDHLREATDLALTGEPDAAAARLIEINEGWKLTDEEWLERTPLLRALRRRLDTLGRPGAEGEPGVQTP